MVKEFGTEKIMFGSDWPVCRLANASYIRVVEVLLDILGNKSENEIEKIFNYNGKSFYNIH